ETSDEHGAPGAANAAPAPDRSAARKSYADTLALYERQGNRQGQAEVLRASAQLELSLDEPEQALVLYARSYDLYRGLGALAPAAEVATTMGDTLRDRRRFAPARERYTQAAAMYQQLKNPEALLAALRKQGDAERALKQIDAARESYMRALAVANQLADGKHRAAVLVRIGDLERDAGQAERARKAYGQALAF